MNAKKTVLVVVAHADDLEFTCGGTVARMTREFGFDVYEYILTDNARGSFRLDAEELIAVSAKEAKRAGDILGLKEVRLEGYTDGDLDQVPMHVLRGQVMAMCREVKADIVISWDPFAPDEDHPDHRTLGMATYEAASFCGNPKFYPEHPHPPYPVTEAYWIAKNPWRAEKYVDITSTIETKIEALLAHDCQMVLTVDSLRQEAEVLGLDLAQLTEAGDEAHRVLIAEGMRAHCAKVGAQAGMEYAELLRYQPLSMLATMLGADAVPPSI